VHVVLGRRWRTPAAVAELEAEVHAALAQYQVEVASGVLGPGPLLVRGYPLGLWLGLDVVASLLPARWPDEWADKLRGLTGLNKDSEGGARA